MSFRPAQYRVLSCASLARAVYAAAARSTAVVTVEVLPQGLHDQPARLRAELQEHIDAIDPDQADAVLLAYGLCGAATAGLTATHVPLVMARAHDCITLHLGSRERYDREFAACPGTYWMSRDFLERNRRGDVATLGVSHQGYQDLVDKHGAENAAYLSEVMQTWARHYQRLVYLEGSRPEPGEYLAEVQAKAERWGLEIQTRRSDHRLMEWLLSGVWGPEFLVVAPGNRIGVGDAQQIVTEQRASTQQHSVAARQSAIEHHEQREQDG
jgi:hypothetical protein